MVLQSAIKVWNLLISEANNHLQLSISFAEDVPYVVFFFIFHYGIQWYINDKVPMERINIPAKFLLPNLSLGRSALCLNIDKHFNLRSWLSQMLQAES